MTVTVELGARSPSWQSIASSSCTHEPWLGVIVIVPNPGGKSSCTTTSRANDGPRFAAVRVHEIGVPATTVAGPVFANASAARVTTGVSIAVTYVEPVGPAVDVDTVASLRIDVISVAASMCTGIWRVTWPPGGRIPSAQPSTLAV